MGTGRYRIEIDGYDQDILASALIAYRRDWLERGRSVTRIDQLILRILESEKKKADRDERE